MDHDVLMHQMRERFEEEFAKALKALEDAPDGHWIDASEMAFRQAALTVAREGLELAGGFWFGLSPTDCNEDGVVNGFDHEIFAACMWGPDFGIDADPCSCFDIDADGGITLKDFAKLQQEYVGP